MSILLAPVDFRPRSLPERMAPLPSRTQGLYDAIRVELEKLARPATG